MLFPEPPGVQWIIATKVLWWKHSREPTLCCLLFRSCTNQDKSHRSKWLMQPLLPVSSVLRPVNSEGRRSLGFNLCFGLKYINHCQQLGNCSHVLVCWERSCKRVLEKAQCEWKGMYSASVAHVQTCAIYSPKLYQVLEYTLFQTGLFLDYLASPYQTAKHVAPLDIIFNYEKCQAIVIDGHEDATITLTTAADAAAVIAKAIGSDKEWPEISGVQGNRATLSQVIKLGERIRGTLQLQYSPNAYKCSF